MTEDKEDKREYEPKEKSKGEEKAVKTVLTLEEALGCYVATLQVYSGYIPLGVAMKIWYTNKPEVSQTKTNTGHLLIDIDNSTFWVDELRNKTFVEKEVK